MQATWKGFEVQSPTATLKIGAYRRQGAAGKTQRFVEKLKTDLHDAQKMLEVRSSIYITPSFHQSKGHNILLPDC